MSLAQLMLLVEITETYIGGGWPNSIRVPIVVYSELIAKCYGRGGPHPIGILIALQAEPNTTCSGG
jgi:hypothetical protein